MTKTLELVSFSVLIACAFFMQYSMLVICSCFFADNVTVKFSNTG